MADKLTLEVHDLDTDVLTGIYSQETHLPQPLKISISADLEMADHYAPDTGLNASKNYMDLKDVVTNLPKGLHFTLIEAVADHIMAQVFNGDARVQKVTVKIIKLALTEKSEHIGITMTRARK